MKNPILKLPLYLGLGIFILTVLVTGFKIGDNKSIASLLTRANKNGAVLSMQNISSSDVSILLTSVKEVSGLDVAIRIEPYGVKPLVSTLSPGPGFAISGGSYDDATSEFTFSALRKEDEPVGDVVASFSIGGAVPSSGLMVDLSFVTGGSKTVVLEKSSGKDILISAEKFSFRYR